MFGGLDIKGSASGNSNADAKAKDDGTTAVTAPPASSAFSFLNLTATTSSSPAAAAPSTHNAAMTEHTTAVTSAFSFLSETSASSPAPAPAVPTMSAFSFLQSTPSLDENEIIMGSSTIAAAATEAAKVPSLSSFSFLTSTTTTSPITPPPAAATTLATHDDVASSKSDMSRFSFLTAPTPLAPVDTSISTPVTSSLLPTSATTTPTAAHKQDTHTEVASASTTTSTTTSAPPLSSSSSSWGDHVATANPNMPAGSGIVFGGAVTLDAASSSKKPIKKRNRISRVGVGAASSLPPSPPKATSTPNQPVAAPTSAAATARDEQEEANRRKHREEAEEATWRAEQFLREKMMETSSKNAAALEQQHQQQSTTTTNNNNNNNAAVEFTRTKSTSSHRSDQYDEDLDDEDDVVAAAIAAAEEAKHLSSSSSSSSAAARQRSLGDRLGGLFQRKPWSQNSVGAPNMVPPMPGGPSSSWTSAGGRSISDTSSGELTAAERIQREQEEIKRAMAERQLVMQQFQQQQQHPQQQQQHFQQQSYQYPPKPSSDEPEHGVSASAETLTRREFVPPTPPLAVVAPQPPAPKSPNEIFDEIMSHFHVNVQKSMDQVGQLRQQRAMLLEERFVTLAKERLASQQMAQAEAQQQAAAESEDFDLADQMGTVLEAHSRERAELDSILESIGRALEQLEIQRVQVVGSVAECFSNVRSRLKKFEKEQLSKESKDDTDAMRKFSTVAKQLSAENERLQQDLKHLERDETLVAEERKELETAISEHSGEHEAQRNEAVEKLHHVEEEIEELRRRLAAKEAVAEELRHEIKSQDEAIGKIRVKFSRQLLRVQTKESTLKENRQEWENEKATFERQKDAHETEVQEHSQALLKHEELMSKLKNEISLAGTFERIVSKEVGFDELLKDNEETDGELAQMHTEVVKCEAAVSKANDVLKAANATLNALEEEHKQLITLIPDLESEKKAAAARRDFKAASKASKEIKDATIRLKECLQELTCEAADRKKAADEELIKLKTELADKRKTTEEKEKISGDAAMLVLAQKIKDLIATKKSICGNASGASVQGIGGFVLNGQIDSLKFEGQSLGSKYGGWDEHLAEIEAIENAEAQEVDAVTAKEAAKDYGELENEASGSDNGVDGDTPETHGDVDAEPAVESKFSSEEKIAKFKELSSQLKDAEESLEAAAANEDYDEAAELEEVFQQLQNALEALDLTDEEMDIAMGSDDGVGSKNVVSAQEVEASESKKEYEEDKTETDNNEGPNNEEDEIEKLEESEVEKLEENTVEKEEEIEVEKMDTTQDGANAAGSEQTGNNPEESVDDIGPANGKSEVPTESNGASNHDPMTDDGEVTSSPSAVMADGEKSSEDDVTTDATDGCPAIQESDVGVQSEC